MRTMSHSYSWWSEVHLARGLCEGDWGWGGGGVWCGVGASTGGGSYLQGGGRAIYSAGRRRGGVMHRGRRGVLPIGTLVQGKGVMKLFTLGKFEFLTHFLDVLA